MESKQQQHLISRRALLAGSVALGLQCSAYSCAAETRQHGVVDVHHHVLPPAYLKAYSESLGGRITGYSYVLQWTIEKSLKEIDQAGVATAVLSMSAPVWFGDVAQSRELARATNEFMREMIRDYPGRFASFACLPMPDIEGSIIEARHAVAAGAVGVGLMSNYEDKYLGDPAFSPIFAEIEKLGVPAYVHPTTASCCNALLPDVAPAMIELPFDTTRSIASLLYSGRFSEHRTLPFIFSHGGGTIPFVGDRLSQWAKARPDLAERLPYGPMAELQRLNFDTSSVGNRYSMASLLEFATPQRVLFGTDYPYVGIAAQIAEIDALGLPAKASADILFGNAQGLMPALVAG
jgi:predicted TIM-barrel fold metal-dependent hydrolase